MLVVFKMFSALLQLAKIYFMTARKCVRSDAVCISSLNRKFEQAAVAIAGWGSINTSV